MSPFTVCAFAIVAAGLIAVLRQLRPELAGIGAAIAGVLIFAYIAEGISPFIEFIKTSSAEAGVESYFTLILKALAISLCCRMSAEICRDCGEGSMATRIELAGKLGIVMMSLPVIQQLFDIAKDMMQ